MREEIGEGKGYKNHFLGLKCTPKEAGVILLPVPFDQTTTYQKGSDKGPAALIEASRNLELYDIDTASEVYKKGIHTDRPVRARTSETLLEKTYARCKEWIAADKFLVVLGGEHAISYAPIRAHAEKYKKLTVLQLDAHADLYPNYEGDLWSHACVMARVRELPQVTRCVSVGIRSLSSSELPYIDPKNTFIAQQLAGHWIDKVLAQLEGPIYLTLDLDVLDPSIMPATGTPEPGGLSWQQVTELLRRVAREKDLVGCDIVELCPQPGNGAPDFLAAKLLYKLLSEKFYGQ